MVLPNFFVPGAIKCATSTFYELLKQHPEIWVAKNKDNDFFYFRHTAKAGVCPYERAQFAKRPPRPAMGDVTAALMLNPDFPRLVREEIGPRVKFVFLLRDPVVRAISHYKMAVRRMYEPLSFWEAVEAERDRLQEVSTWVSTYGYVTVGRYEGFIRNFLEYFPREQMFFVLYETDFSENRAEMMRQVFEFLGVDPSVKIDLSKHRGYGNRDTWAKFYESGEYALSKRRSRFSRSVGRWASKAFGRGGPQMAPYPVVVVSEAGKVRTFYDPSEEMIHRLRMVAEITSFELPLDEQRRLYSEKFADSIDALEPLIGKDLGLWRDRYK